MSMKFSGVLAAGAAIMLAASATSTIADDTTDITVSATIPDACEFGTVTDIVFGEYVPGQTTVLSKTGSMDIVCTAADVATIAVAGGNPVNGTSFQMDDDNGNFVSYDLNDPNGNPWTTAAYSESFGAGTTTLPFTASMPASQNAPAGAYADTVTLTMTF